MTANLVSLLQGLELIFYFLLLVRMFSSFVPNINPNNPFIRGVYRITEPMLAPFRNILPSNNIGIDLSPIFAFLALRVSVSLLIGALT